MLAFFLFSCLFLYVNSHPNNYCSGYCSANTYCAPSSCRRRGGFRCNCQPCPSGKTSSKGAWDISQCTGCSKGKYYVSSTCKNCPAGKYQQYTGQTECKVCACGKYSSSAATSCTSCKAGKYSSSGANSCSTCVWKIF